ncbi:MAG: uridine phosphorylase [Candidatus Pacebacteria bacterium]|nr:uridine phosphorylase [Candidatus Paceibacterota bacterium]
MSIKHPEIERESQQNPHLVNLEVDYLYHLGLDTSMDLPSMFGDVKYVCMGGSPERAEQFAIKAAERLGISVPEEGLEPVGKTERYSLYKVGPIISLSHGIGMPSASIVLHEVTKLLRYAGSTDFKYIRIGTSGGVGVDPGEVVVSTNVVDGKLNPVHEVVELGKSVELDTALDSNLVQSLLTIASESDISATAGTTMSTDSFYAAQGRLDGALNPRYTETEKMDFLQLAYDKGVRNIEMEAAIIGAFCREAGIPAAVVCAAILNRLDGDQVGSTIEELEQFSDNAQQLVLNLISKELNLTD